MPHRPLFRLAAAAVILLAASRLAFTATVPRDGDLIFQTSKSAQSAAVQQATHSRYSHMGVVLYRNGQPMVFEASATVTYTPFAAWTARGVGGAYAIRRLKAAPDAEAVKKLKIAAKSFEGVRYDTTFEWSDTRMYCSELVWKLYDRALGIDIGERATLRDFDLSSPAVRQKIQERYSGDPPLGEAVISPQAMFDSALLESVPVP